MKTGKGRSQRLHNQPQSAAPLLAPESRFRKAKSDAPDKMSDGSFDGMTGCRYAGVMTSGRFPRVVASFRSGRSLGLASVMMACVLPSATATATAQDAVSPELKPLQAIEIPTDEPPEGKNPFDNKERWLEPMTVPPPKQKIKAPIVIGDRGKKSWPTLVLTPGSNWSGTGRGRVELSGGNVVAKKCRFDKLVIEVDHACRYFFVNCAFDDCRFGKGGIWYGGDLAGKYFFENCIIRKNFANPINLVDTGFRIQTSVFENIELPTMNFREKEAADYVNERWLRIVNCRFVKCTIPISFLLLTRDCVFENCTFVDDKKDPNKFKKLIEVDLFVKNSKSKISAYPANVILNQKPDTELKDVTIPTAASLLPGITP